MNILSQLSSILFRRFGILFQPIEQVTLLDKNYRVIRGSIREQQDYDDAWLLALAYHSDLVFDIGCNVGQSTFVLLYPDVVQRIVLVDPNPKALAIAAENLILNYLSHKTYFMCAFVSEQTGENIPFHTVGTGAAGSMYKSHAKTASRLGSSFFVPTVSLDWLCEWYHCVPDVVKIDVEGAEINVLQGAAELAKKQKTKFFVEMHSNANLSMLDNAESVIDWCGRNKYIAWYLKGKIVLQSPQAIEQRGRCHLLLLPQHDSFPVYMYSIEQGDKLVNVVKALGQGAV